MYEISKKFLDELIDNEGRSLVGRLCKRIEVLERQKFDNKSMIKLLKELIKELVYEKLRDIKFEIICFNEGREAHKTEFNAEKE